MIKKMGFICMMLLTGGPSLAFGLDVGDKAPLFEVDSTQGKITLADYQGKKNVVLALYFAAFTSV